MKAIMTRAHQIRKEAAIKWDCKISEIAFSFCLKRAWAESKGDFSRKENGMTKFEEKGMIDEDNLDIFKKSLNKLNRKLIKNGLPEVCVEYGKTETRKIGHEMTCGGIGAKVIIIHEIPITMTWECNLVIGGYKLIATLEKINGAIFSKTVPGEELKERYEEVVCNHCGHKRARKYGYVLEEVSTGKHIMVGKTCLKDYIGHDPKQLILLSEFRFPETPSNRDYTEGGYTTGHFSFGLEYFLLATYAVIDQFGYTSVTRANQIFEEKGEGPTPTKDIITRFLFSSPLDKNSKKFIDRIMSSIKKGIDKVPAIIEHFEKKIDSSDLCSNSYLSNLDNIIIMGEVPYKFAGYAASMVGVYERDMEKKEEIKRERENQIESQYVGQIRERLRGLKLKIIKRNEFDGGFGLTYIFTFIDSEGNIFKWFSSTAGRMEPGEEVVLDGTVKKQEEDKFLKYQKVTTLTRCKIK